MKNHYHQFKLLNNDDDNYNDNNHLTITMVFLPELNLYIITDAKGFGQNWIRVTYCQKIFNTKLLLGIDENDYITSIARYLSEPIIKYKLSNNNNNNDPLIMVKDIVINFNISLRIKNFKQIQMIYNEFNKYFNNNLQNE